MIDRKLHSNIHESINTVFTPNGGICKQVYQELCRQKALGFVSSDDPPWIRLEWLAEQFEVLGCDMTASVLRWQKSKISAFYKGS